MRREGSNILLTLNEWQAAGLSYNMYENDKRRECLRTANCGGGGHVVEIIYQSIAKECRKEALKAYFKGDPEKMMVQNELVRHIRESGEIKAFFTDYRLPDGQTLGEKNYKKVLEYYNNAIVLEAAGAMHQSIKAHKKAGGNAVGMIWPTVAEAVNALDRDTYPHTLPAHPARLREKCIRYHSEGPADLVHKSYGNKFSRKVNERLERLILSIYCMTNKPYAKWVHEDYMSFIAGSLSIVDMQTGELFDREEFRNKKGQYITISEATCWNYINNPKNRAIVDAIRNSEDYHDTEAPHYHRHVPEYAFSKISLDDVNLPQLIDKKKYGSNHVMAYYVYDVCSGALIGAAYSVHKDGELFKECLRDMYRFMATNGYGVPIEIELEHHIAGNYKDTFLTPGVLFERVYWCAPGNSQEKHAEQFNRQKKYMYAKRLQDNIGRHYARLEANQTGGQRVWDEEEQAYVIRQQAYSYEEVVASDLEVIAAYNNGLHSDQEKYKGMTRLEVLHARMHPHLAPVNNAAVARWLGECTKTTIVRNMYFQVQYKKYMLPSPELLGRLAPNNYTVEAYYLPAVDSGQSAVAVGSKGDKDNKDSKGSKDIERVFIYQHDKFLGECRPIETFTTARAEWTDADAVAMTEQAKYIAKFNRIQKEGKENIAHVKEIKNIAQYEAAKAVEVETQEPVPVFVNEYSEEFQAASAMDSL
jgi:hypothetical protein